MSLLLLLSAVAGGGGDPALEADRLIHLVGDDLTGSDSDPVVTWDDQSGNNYDFTRIVSYEPTKKTNIANGHTVARFAGDAGTFPNDFSGLTEATVYLVVKIVQDPPASDPQTGLWTLGSAGDATHFPYSDGTIYDGFGSTARKTTGNPTLDLSSEFRVYAVVSSSSEWTSYIDGAQHYTTGTNTVGFGASGSLGNSNSAAYLLHGDVAEFVIFSVAHDASKVGGISDFLKDKYVTGAASAVGWYRASTMIGSIS